MRLKNRYLAIIVVVMLVTTALLASWVVGSVQGTRVAYVAVRADKSDYALGENVTFSLVPLAKGLQFTVNGGGSQGGVYIVRLPDDVDPDTYLDDPQAVYSISNGMHIGGGVAVPIPRYNTTGEPLRLSWNGTMMQFDPAKQAMAWDRATAGYYLLSPAYNWEYGHVTKFMLDRSSIFHLDGPAVRFDISYESSMFTVRTEISMPIGGEPVSGLFTTVVPNHVNYSAEATYHNETVDLVPGGTTTVVLSYPGPDQYYEKPSTNMIARIIMGDTTFVFGFYPMMMYDNGEVEVRYVPF
jgi:hypothetical protein